MTSFFSRCLAHILAEEGGYVFDPKDPGGETKYGISKRAHPSVDIKALTPDQAGAIYKANYWNPISGDALPAGVALIVFDMAVNQGARRAAITLQTAVGAKADGAIGPKTIEAVKSRSPVALIQKIAEMRTELYLGMDNATEERFEKGWIKRLIRTVILAIQL